MNYMNNVVHGTWPGDFRIMLGMRERACKVLPRHPQRQPKIQGHVAWMALIKDVSLPWRHRHMGYVTFLCFVYYIMFNPLFNNMGIIATSQIQLPCECLQVHKKLSCVHTTVHWKYGMNLSSVKMLLINHNWITAECKEYTRRTAVRKSSILECVVIGKFLLIWSTLSIFIHCGMLQSIRGYQDWWQVYKGTYYCPLILISNHPGR